MMAASSLRERRRQQTALDIQMAALDLIAERGLSQVTTGMIAARAGVSLRTFFNYYPNKEAASVGHPPEFSETAVHRFVTGTGTLAEGLADMLREQFTLVAARHDMIEQLLAQVRRTPELLLPLEEAMREHRDALARILRRRLVELDPADATLLADLLLAAIRHAILSRPADESAGLEDIALTAVERLRRTGTLLAGL